jgi:hypothetical protein
MLLKGPRSHTSSTTLFTSPLLVIYGVYCKGIFPNTVSCISVTTFFYVYFAGDPIWTMLVGESDSLRLVGFINNRQWLLRLHENARLHVTDYNDYSSDSTSTSGVHQQPSSTTWLREECTATRWRLLWLLTYKIVEVNSAQWHAGNCFDYSSCLQN